jgi:hypothetical protein
VTWRTVTTKERSSFLNRRRIAGDRIGDHFLLAMGVERKNHGKAGDHPAVSCCHAVLASSDSGVDIASR